MKDNRLLLEKFLDGICTKEEIKQVNLMDRNSRRKMLLDILEQRERSATNDLPEPTAEMEQSAEMITTEVLQQIVKLKSPRSFLTRTVLRWSGIAAIFAGMVILSGVFLWNKNNNTDLFGNKEQAVTYAELSNPNGVPELHELPDGTQIWLAAGSALKYPEQFSEKHRDVKLSGEAFFDVARDEKRPFTIRTSNMETRVLGTSFKITAFAGQEQEVSVATGKVSVNSNGQELALLTRGLQIRHNPETGETTQTEIDPATLEDWKAGTLIFDKLPMSYIAEQLESRYGITIEFADPQIGARRLRSSFSPEKNITEVLTVLSMIGNFKYKNTKDKYYTIY